MPSEVDCVPSVTVSAVDLSVGGASAPVRAVLSAAAAVAGGGAARAVAAAPFGGRGTRGAGGNSQSGRSTGSRLEVEAEVDVFRSVMIG
jgi:hypothetical protein